MKKIWIVGILASVIFIFIFLWPIIFSINKPLGGGDIVLGYFSLQNNFEKISTFDFTNFFDTRMYYPRKLTLAFGNGDIGQAILGMPIYLMTKNVFLSANFSLLLSFFASFLATYFLAWKFIRNIGASLIAGVIFNYNPYVFSHLFNQLELTTLMWIPLIFLAAEGILETIKNKISWRWSLLLSLFFIMQILSSIYYAFFIIILLPIYIFLRMQLLKISFKKLTNPTLILSLGTVLILGYLFIQPFSQAKRMYRIDRPFELLPILSAKPSDFLFTSQDNLMYGWMTHKFQWLRDTYTVEHPTEHILFPGLIVYILLIIAALLYIKRYFDIYNIKILTTFFILLGLSVILSMGPYLQVAGLNIPLPYLLIYKLFPIIDSIRAPSRFMVIGYLSLAIICSLTWVQISAKWSSKKARLAMLAVLILISFEYLHKLPVAYEINPEIRHFYSWLDSQKDIKVILELPIGNDLYAYPNLYRAFSDDAIYLLYGIYHTKRMVNGYNGFIPPDYATLGDRLTVNFPTKEKLDYLKKLPVDLIIVHKDKYLDSQLGEEVRSKLRDLGFKNIYDTGNISAFRL